MTRLRLGDRVCAVVEGRPCPGDLGVVAEIGITSDCRTVAVVAWDSGDVDQVTRAGRPDGTCGEIGAEPTGERWDRQAAKAALAACLEAA